MNVLLLGSGGRENAIAWIIKKSTKLKKLFIAPGNHGTSLLGENVKLDISNFENIQEFIVKEQIKLLIVGPEQPIVEGIYDYLRALFNSEELIIIAPSKLGGALEGSKKFAKEFMEKYNIPNAKYKTFNKNKFNEAIDYLKTLSPPYVLKADGLAAGKGVVISNKTSEAKDALHKMLIENQFGEASDTVLIEEFLDGIELSVFVLTNGKDYKILPVAKDYKRIGEGNTGLNTGGMGSVSPPSFVDEKLMQKIKKDIIQPTIIGLQKENIVYNGFIFFGLIDVKGEPKVIEYNARLGDPETQSVLPRIKSDFLDLLMSTKNEHEFSNTKIEVEEKTCLSTILASKGYPENYSKGFKISGLESISEETIIFHAGTTKKEDDILTNGGRVLAITSFGKNLAMAKKNNTNEIEKLSFQGMVYRSDIGFDLK
tara:strand:- start:246 stop:1526 length:1281 start_codon:yes stop_codon:yes gene_type:complete